MSIIGLGLEYYLLSILFGPPLELGCRSSRVCWGLRRWEGDWIGLWAIHLTDGGSGGVWICTHVQMLLTRLCWLKWAMIKDSICPCDKKSPMQPLTHLKDDRSWIQDETIMKRGEEVVRSRGGPSSNPGSIETCNTTNIYMCVFVHTYIYIYKYIEIYGHTYGLVCCSSCKIRVSFLRDWSYH